MCHSYSCESRCREGPVSILGDSLWLLHGPQGLEESLLVVVVQLGSVTVIAFSGNTAERQSHGMVKSPDLAWVETHLLAVCSWASYLLSLCLSLLTCKMESLLALDELVCVKYLGRCLIPEC